MSKLSIRMMSSAVLSFSAGFSDTATFVSAGQVFSAHVTGNFVVFAYKMSQGLKLDDFISLLTFPVFILAVYFTGIYNRKYHNEHSMLLFAGFILCFSALISLLGAMGIIVVPSLHIFITMSIVFSMGILNAANKLCPKSTFGPATVMTGNVTKATLEFYNGYFSSDKTQKNKIAFKQTLVLILGFLIGCLLGAILSSIYGLVSIVIPGLLIVVYYNCIYRENRIVV